MEENHEPFVVSVVIGAATLAPDTVSAAPPPDDPVGDFVVWAEAQGYTIENPACAISDDGAILCYAIETSTDQTRIVSRVLFQGIEQPDVWVREDAAAVPSPTTAVAVPTTAPASAPTTTAPSALGFGNGHYTGDQMPAPGTYVLVDDGSGVGAGCAVHLYSDLTANNLTEFVWTENVPGTYYLEITAEALAMDVEDCAGTWELVP